VSELGGAFPGTRWSLVQRVAEPRSRIGTGTRRRVFEELALSYWRPVYRTVRVAYRKAAEEAEDVTQSFFLDLFEKGTLDRFDADPKAGRFRSLIRSLLDGFVHTWERNARRKKRGGDRRHVPLDAAEVAAIEERITREPDTDPFEREWRAALLDGALAEMARASRSPLWERRHAIFLAHDVEPVDDAARPTYAELARRFSVKPHDVKNDLVAARRRFAEAVLDRLRDESPSEEAARDEIRALFGGP
jgi:RNA polymerase sigma factor (sigma-70 family)